MEIVFPPQNPTSAVKRVLIRKGYLNFYKMCNKCLRFDLFPKFVYYINTVYASHH